MTKVNFSYPRLTLLLAIFFCTKFNACAQDLLFTPVSGREQLNEEQIRNIIQLKDGRLGVFTEGMLNLYDGSGFKTIHIDDENTMPLPNYTGFHHSYVESNRLWFKNGGRLAIINLVNEQTNKQPRKVLNTLGIDEVPADLFVDTYEDIWILTDSNKLICRESKTGSKKTFLKNINTASSPHDKLYDITRMGDLLYLSYKSGLLRCFNRYTAKEIYQKNVVPKQSEDFKDWLHVTAVNQYLYFTRGGYYKGQLLRYDTVTHHSTILLQANDYWLNCFAGNKNGGVFMSCRKGLWYFKPGSSTGTLLKTIDIKDGGKIQTEISTIFYDSQGGFWAGTFNKGLYYYHPERFRFQSITKQRFNAANMPDFQVSCFQETNDRKLLIGTNTGLYKTDKYNLNTSTVTTLLNGIVCNHLFKDKAGSIWIASSAGIYKMEMGGIIKQITPVPANYIYEWGDTLYICTVNKGILTLDTQSLKLNTIKNTDSLQNVTQVVAWNNSLMGLSNQGPFVFDMSKTTVQFPLKEGEKRLQMFKYTNHRYTCLLKDSDGDLWLGTYDGLTMWNKKEKKLYQLHTTEGIINNSIKAIAEDKDHSLWVTTSRGISHLVKNKSANGYNFTIENYNEHTGVFEHAFAERCIFLSSGATVFTGSIDGVNYITAENKKNALALTPVLLNLTTFENTDNQKGLNALLTYKKNLELKYNQNFFSITFSGLNYTNPSQTYYRYMLQEIDEDWRKQKTQSGIGEANYTSLPPGDYIFKIQASTDGIRWPGPVKTINISITPPWWKTTYAYAAYIIFCMSVTFIIIRQITLSNRIRRHKQQERAIEQAKTDFITNISHELRTPLTMVITPLRVLITKVTDTKTKKDLELINNSAQLMLDTVTQLLEFKKMDSGHEILHCYFYDNLLFIKELCATYSQLASEKQVSLISEIFEGDVHIFIDRQKVTRIIINLLSNAIKFTPPGGTVHIKILPDEVNGILKIVVTDTGIGIEKEELDNIFDRFYQAENQNESALGSGIGLFMVKQYAQLHHGNVTANSTPGRGTTFKVTISVSENVKTIHHNSIGTVNTSEKTILIVEDNQAFREYLAAELKQSYEVISCSNGKTALDEAIKSVPDLIISDMGMPEMTGPEFFRALRNDITVSHIPLIMLTGRTSDEARFEGYQSGADAYLVKPFDVNILRIRIEKLLQLGESRKTTFLEEREVKTEAITTNPLDKDLLDRALKYVNKNLSNPDYTVEKFSADMGMDRTGLYRKLVALTGFSPINFIRTLRLKKAAELLSEGRLPIADIAGEVGFNSLSYFSKCFHESYHVTPRQYREEKISKN